MFRAKFRETLEAFDRYEHIYTDALKDGSAVARLGFRVKRLPNDASLFSFKVRAILLALNTAEQAGSNQLLIMSDSISCLQSMESRHLNKPLVLEIIMRLHGLFLGGRNLNIRVVP